MNKCGKTVAEYVTSHRWSTLCVLPAGHPGRCDDSHSCNGYYVFRDNVRGASVSYPVDANGSPL